MLPDRVSNPGHLTYESGALPIALRGPARLTGTGICSKVNQFIYTLVLRIFCSQGCSYTKCLCPKKENNSTENLRNRFKS